MFTNVPAAVLPISRDWSRSGIKSCNPKNQIWDLSRNKWYLSQSGCGIKSGINTTFLARNCGSALTAQPRRTTEPGVLGAWTILRDIGTSARKRRVWSSPRRSFGDCQQSDIAKLARRMANRALHQRAPPCEGCPMFIHPDDRPRRTAARCQCTWRARSLVGARVAIWRASFATSDCWQSPQLRGGLDHTPFSRRCSNISQK